MGAFKARVMAGALYQLAKVVLSQLSAQDAKEWIDDRILDPLEVKYQDNKAILLSINFVRQVASIPDDIGGDED